MTTVTTHLKGTERMAWEMTVPHMLRRRETAYLWKQIRDWAIGRVGHVVYRGDVWEKNVDTLAKEALTELGVPWEMRCGYLYIDGRRVYWNSTKGRYESDDYRH